MSSIEKKSAVIWWFLLVEVEINMLSAYLEALDTFFQTERAKLSIPEDEDWRLEERRLHLLEANKEFLNRFLGAFIINLYSVIESALIARSKLVNPYFVSPDQRVLEQCKDCLKTDVVIKEAFGSPEWNQIKIIGEIRNFIVHSMGNVKAEKRQQLKKYIDVSGDIVLTKEDCKTLLRNVKGFMEKIDDRGYVIPSTDEIE